MDFKIRETVDMAALPWWFLRLPGPAENMFEEQTARERNRQLRFWVAASLVFSWLCFGLDLITFRDVIWLDVCLRVLLVTPIAVLAMRMLHEVRHGWRGTCVVIMSPLACTLVQIGVFAASAHFELSLSTYVTGSAVLWMNLLFPMRVRDAAMFTGLTIGLGDALNISAALWHHTGLNHLDEAAAMHCVATLSLLARAMSEQNMRRSFVHGLKLQIHVDDLSRANVKLREISNTDPLTGLANRRFFDATLDHAWKHADETRRPLALMMIDVDHFKLFNDTAGHLEGDRCLVTIAQTIDRQIRKGQDTTARFGGEEFVVLMPDADAALAELIADRVHAAISTQRVFHPARIAHGFVSVSIGVAALRPADRSGTPADLICAADKALYAAKAAGRDQVAQAADAS